MRHNLPLFVLLVSAFVSTTLRAEEQPIEYFEVEQHVSYWGQGAINGTLSLAAHNGFFDSGSFVAIEETAAPVSEHKFITKHFSALSCRSTSGFARWHLWVPKPGTLQAKVLMEIPKSEAGVRWEVCCGSDNRVVKAVASTGSKPQPWNLAFRSRDSRKQTVSLRKLDAKPTPKTKIHHIELTGDAIDDSKLLRVRWRPAAVHTSFQASTCQAATMWVFESQSIGDTGSYSPITTPFGYYGTSFDSHGTIDGGFNFSMWAASSKTKAAPPLETMPHLIATGNPDAEFSGFGHEGSGVKIRGWDCIDWKPTSVIQALRIEKMGDRIGYFGYFYHEPEERWVLYAAGMAPPKRRAIDGTFTSVGSFCEVPGPPHVQRSGDLTRIIQRRGWFYGTDKKWHPVDTQKCRDASGENASSARSISTGKDQWLISSMGGMELTSFPKQVTTNTKLSSSLQPYLATQKAQQLFELPVDFKNAHVLNVKANSAEVVYDLENLEPDAKATLYYGTTDCLTFLQRKLHGTEKKGASNTFYSKDRTWQTSTVPQTVRNGKNTFQLSELKPSTQYYFRLFVTHCNGKSWAYESGKFKTR